MSSSMSFTPGIEVEELTLPHNQSVTMVSHLPGPLTLKQLADLTDFIATFPPEGTLLLRSAHSTIPPLSPPEEQEWLLQAGALRRAQETFKHQGGRLFSLVTECLMGGTYLVFGMAATRRLVYPNVQIYPALPPDRYEPLFQRPYPHPTTPETALHSGLITDIIPAGKDEELFLPF